MFLHLLHHRYNPSSCCIPLQKENKVTNPPFLINADTRLASAPIDVHMQITGPDALRTLCLSVAKYQA